MAKFKSRRSISKRFKLTKTGKLMHRCQNSSHLIKQKSKMARRRHAEPKALNKTFAKKILQTAMIKI